MFNRYIEKGQTVVIIATTIAMYWAAPLAIGAPSSDPSVHTDRNSVCTWRITCGGTRGQMKWSPTGGHCWDDTPPNTPLAVILRGNGYDYRDYDYLQNHLARNGILSASIDVVSSCGGSGDGTCSADHQAVADKAESYLTSTCFDQYFLDKFSTSQPVDFQKTAVIGHSRGGESARFLAATLDARTDFGVPAVVALAPTRHTYQGIYGTSTSAYLLLYGTSDTDVPPYQAFESYDSAGWNEWSTPTIFDLDRSMKLFGAGTHQGFGDNASALGAAAQRTTTKGYVHAFLRAWLRGDWRFYSSFIRGHEKPGTFAGDIHTQYSTSISRRVIDNFEHNSLSPNTMGGTVSQSGMSLAAPWDGDSLSSTPHQRRFLRLIPNQNYAFIAWNIPEDQRNAVGYRYLSLRIGQLVGNGSANARLWIRNNGLFSFVDLADYGGIPEPRSMCLSGFGGGCNNIADQGFMHTVRIPLDDFGAHGNVETVYLQFIDDSAINREFIVDNLEFAESGFIVLEQ